MNAKDWIARVEVERLEEIYRLPSPSGLPSSDEAIKDEVVIFVQTMALAEKYRKVREEVARQLAQTQAEIEARYRNEEEEED